MNGLCIQASKMEIFALIVKRRELHQSDVKELLDPPLGQAYLDFVSSNLLKSFSRNITHSFHCWIQLMECETFHIMPQNTENK